ncbi:MAG: M48 family metalloprotease [Treponema sp.]|nr:M48 family metalloprotease [Treponema sp.]
MKHIGFGLTCCLMLLVYTGCVGVLTIGPGDVAKLAARAAAGAQAKDSDAKSDSSSADSASAASNSSAARKDASPVNAGASAVDFDSVVSDALNRMDTALKASEEITPAEEYYIGRAVAANILSKYKIYASNTDLIIYINKILMVLAINSPRPDIYNGYHAVALDSQEINAFSTPGGHIFITRGLLACANSEDALAAVLAHELAHIQLHHGIDSVKDQRFTGALHDAAAYAAGVAMEAAGVPELTRIFDSSIREMVTTMITNGYSQDQEFQADTVALSLLADAGYSPSAILDMFNVLKQNVQGQVGLGKTHPSVDSRINNVNKSISKYQTPNVAQFRKARFDALKK